MKTNYSIPSQRRAAFLGALIVTALSGGFSILGATAAEASTPQAHSDGITAVITDTAITAKVKADLMGEKSLDNSDISVTTTNGVVTLNGAASSSSAKELAEAQTRSVEGVKSVDNNLKTPGSSETVNQTKRIVSDSWITTKVKSELLADNVSKGFDVGVETIHGVVVLKGKLANTDAIDHVKDIAAKVNGVKSVDSAALAVAVK